MATGSYSHTPRTAHRDFTTIPENIQKFADKHPDKEAFVFLTPKGDIQERQSISWRSLLESSKTFARGLLSLGIKPGDVVPLGLPNIPEWPICTYGVITAGAIALNFLFHRKDASDLIHTLNTARASTVIFHPGAENSNVEVMKTLLQNTKNGICIPQKHTICTTETNVGESCLTVDEIMKLGEENKEATLPTLDPDDTCMILPTSGSTGYSKLVPWSHYRILSSLLMYVTFFDAAYDGKFFNERTFNWMGGQPFYTISSGNTHVTIVDILTLKSPKEIAENAVRAIESEKCLNAFLITPCVIYLQQAKYKLDENFWPLSVVVMGGRPLPSSIARNVGNLAKVLANVYACTEVGFMAMEKITSPFDVRDFSVGTPFQGVEIKVVDDEGNVVARGEHGEIYARLRERFEGYLGVRDSPVTKSGWYKTGDIGYMNDNGSLVVDGRKKSIVKCGGTKVIPLYTENILRTHSAVLDVMILPVPDEEFYQVACACIVLKPNFTITKEDLKSFYEEHHTMIPGTYGMSFNAPKYYLLFDRLPRTAVGKVDIKAVLEEARLKLNL